MTDTQDPPSPPVRRSSGRLGLLAAGLILLAGGVGLGMWLARRPATAPATVDWGQPTISERFDDETWPERWRVSAEGVWAWRDGAMTSVGPGPARLALRRRLSLPVAIEYTGRMQAGSRPCDLSMEWTEGDLEPEKTDRGRSRVRTWQFQAGAYDNMFCAIFLNPGENRKAYNPLRLENGRDYRFRVEIDGEQMVMWADGVEIMRYRERFPPTSGHVVLYGFYPGKTFDDVTVWQKGQSARTQATAMGDGLMELGHFADAAAVYGRIAAVGGDAAQEALFRKGLAERRAGRPEDSRETWSHLTDPALTRLAEVLRLEDVFATGQHDVFLQRLQEQWRASPDVRDDLRQQWQRATKDLMTQPDADKEQLLRYLAARQAVFPDDVVSAYDAAAVLYVVGRYAEVLERFPGERRWSIPALIALGRHDEFARLADVPVSYRSRVRYLRGDLAGLAADTDADPVVRVVALCKLGRSEEVVDGKQLRYPVMLHRGQAVDLLETRPLSVDQANEALICAGRLEEAAGDGLPDVANSGRDYRARLLLGRLEPPAQRLRISWPKWPAVILACEKGDAEAIAAARAAVSWPHDFSQDAGWFSGVVIGPMADRQLGQKQAVESSLQRAAKELPHFYGGRASRFAQAVLGQIDGERLRAMPMVTEAGAWVLLADGLRAELAGDVPAALAAYRGFTALPVRERLLDHNVPDVQIEVFVAWRLRVLGR